MVKTIKKEKNQMFLTSVFLCVLILLAILRWLPSGDALSPETGSRGWVEIVILLFSLVLMFFLWGPKSFFVGFTSPTFIVSLVFGLWAMLTALWSPNFVLSFGKAISLICIVMVMAGVAQKCNESDIHVSDVIFLTLTIMIGFLLLVNYFFFEEFIPINWAAYRPRFTLGFDHPNVAATIFVFHILTGIETVKYLNNFRSKVLVVLVIFSSTILLYLTDSRTSLISLLICIFIYAVLHLRTKMQRILSLVVPFLLFCLGLVLLISGFFDQILFNVLNLDKSAFLSLEGRVMIWLLLFKNLPPINLLGLGYYSPRFYNLAEFKTWGYTAHNSYLEIYSATGMVGFFLLSAFFVTANKIFLNGHRYPLAFAALVYSILAGLLETRLLVAGVTMAFLLLLIFESNLLTVPFIQQEKV